jgi:hypothetical protein
MNSVKGLQPTQLITSASPPKNENVTAALAAGPPPYTCGGSVYFLIW